MNKQFFNFFLGALGTLLFISSCTTDPIIPAGGVPLDPPIQDPGEENLCEDGVISFQHEVLPLMVSSCAYSGCHDPATAAEGVVLDSYENVRKEVSPGDLNDSELYEYLFESGDERMPPPPAEPLTAAQKDVIKNWILQGAENTDCGLPCDSTQTSFAADIYPLIQNYCVGCHNLNRTDGGVRLDGYDEILPYVENGSLIGSVSNDPYYPIMPPSGSSLSECRITQIKKWINEGALNN